MSDPTIPVHPSPSAPRPRPVVWYGAFTAALGAFLGFAGLVDLMPKTVIAWIALVGAVVTAAGAVLVQSTVTPLSDPQNAEGVPLISQDVARLRVKDAVRNAVADVTSRPMESGPRDLGSTRPGHSFPRD